MSQSFSPDPAPITYFNMEMSLGDAGTGESSHVYSSSFPKSSTYTLSGHTLCDLKLSLSFSKQPCDFSILAPFLRWEKGGSER